MTCFLNVVTSFFNPSLLFYFFLHYCLEILALCALQLFSEEKYEMAMKCFGRAGEQIWEKWAKAAHLRAASSQMSGSNPKSARKMLREAAEMFHCIGKADSAAECFCDLNEYQSAGLLWLQSLH